MAQSFLRCRRMESDSGELESLWDSKKRELSQEMVQEMGVSIDRGTPKWMVYKGNSHQNG